MSALHAPVLPFFEQGLPERLPPILALATGHAASAKLSFLNDEGIEPPQHRYQKRLRKRGRIVRREADVENPMKFAMKLEARNMIALRRADVAG